MQAVEIRQSKRKLIPMLVLLAMALSGLCWYAYFSGRFGNSNVKFIFIIPIAFLAYAIFIPVRKFIHNDPVLLFNSTGIEINENIKPVSFSWYQVTNWMIDRKDNTYYLIISAGEKKIKVNISWLDKSPVEIATLLTAYKKNDNQ